MATFLYLLLGVIALCYLFVKKRYSFWSDRGFEGPVSVFPFGSMKGIGTDVSQAEGIDAIYKQFKGKVQAIAAFTFLIPTLVIIDPELIKSILVREFSSFVDRGFYYNKEDDPISANLLTLKGQEWRDRRVKLTPIFTSGKMKMMFETVDEISDKFVETLSKNLEKTNILELREFAARYTADVIGNVAFGLDCQCLDDPNSEFIQKGRKVFDLTSLVLFKFFIATGFPKLASLFHVTITPKESADFFLNTFLQTLDYREKNNIRRNDFVSLLLALKGQLTPKELAAESFIVYVGGFETSSTLISYTMLELAKNLDIQERLRQEIKSGLKENDGKLTYDMLIGFKYLDMVINESLRKYPPIPAIGRVCTKEFPIPGTSLVIPKDTPMEIPTFSLHRDPEYFPDPETFDPERFSPENVEARNPFTYLPFGDGPRNCLGLRFGLMQSKFAIVKSLLNFELSTCEKSPVPIKLLPSSPFLAPVGGLWLKLEKLN